ncbi:DUF7848 domain-containing protein [Streptomyces sp. B21-083]|uniref:DUF7848 domain-containing protein n=1 Tax=Streptomyces sp. B21-083 TaxID=3039410 RepID=UPI002FF1A3C3
MTRRVFRYVPYLIVQDPTAEPEYAARCVSGEESDCGAESGVRQGPADVEEWQRRHTQDTRHTRYRRTFADYAVLEPQGGGYSEVSPCVVEFTIPGSSSTVTVIP